MMKEILKAKRIWKVPSMSLEMSGKNLFLFVNFLSLFCLVSSLYCGYPGDRKSVV